MNTYIGDDLNQAIDGWKRNRRLKQSSITVYSRWIKRFQFYCCEYDLDEHQELTLTGTIRFAKKYALLKRCEEKTVLRAAKHLSIT